MSVAKFEIGDLVWAKKKDYPLWPAKISQPPKEEKKKGMHYVCFLKTETCAWVPIKKIQHHAEHLIPPYYEKKSPFLKLAIDEIILLSKDKLCKEASKVSPEIGVQNLEEKESMEDKQLMEEKQPPIERCSYEVKSTVKEKHSYKEGKQLSLKKPVKEKQPPVKQKKLSLKKPVKEKQPLVEEKQPSLKEPVKEKQPPVEEKQPSSKEPVKEKQLPVEEKQPSLKEPVKEKQPHVEEKQPSVKEPAKEKQPPVEEKKPSSKEPVKEKQPPVKQKKLSLKKPVKEKQPLVEEKQPSLKETEPVKEKQPHVEEKQPSSKEPVKKKKPPVEEKQPLKEPVKEKQPLVDEKQPSPKEPVKEKQPPVEEKQPSLKEPKEKQSSLKEPVKEKQPPVEEKQPLKEQVKEKQPLVDEKQPSPKEPVKEKQPPVEEKQPSLKEPVKEKQPSVEEKQPLKEPVKEKPPVTEKKPTLKKPLKEKQSSLKKQVKKKHPVEEKKVPIKKQRIEEKQPPIKENLTSIKKNPVKGKQVKKILSREKPKKVEKAGDSVKSQRVVGRKRSLSKGSVIGETSMSGLVPCPKIQKLDEDDSSHNKSSTDLSNPKNPKLDDDKHSVSSSSSNQSVYPGLIFRGFNDDDDCSVSSLSSHHSQSRKVVRHRKVQQKVKKLDDNHSLNSPSESYAFTFSDKKIFIPHREPSPVDNQYEERFKMKHVIPTSKKIGFLGLGKMGRRIVKNLLIAGHKLIVWNRTKDKCKEFVEAGATQAENPAEVVKAADIIFNCVSDVYAVKTILFCPDGVLKGLEDSCAGEKNVKGYIEMSSIGYESSQEIANDIILNGGRYLEACMTGTKTSANLGALFILASGDEGIFQECLTCFHAIADNTYFLSDEIGVSSLFSITLSMCTGTAYAALAEVAALANRLKIDMTDVLALLRMRGIASKPLLEKGRNMIKGEFFNVEHSLINQQKDMDLALELSNDYNHPLHMAAAANEVYKHAKMLGYGDHDVSAVFRGVKH
ncbi:putative oxidoreductase GLYR1 homolog [Trichonephila clavata]|uniref:Cytokine-like nuclear factor N-PAC n=1 Tax=Trichonephila clavata TaxID=2740835 RepID=A0A8X6IGI2_TRICU|nr:putative oxidoreductase GLYR1 homolog [Trichonephila clavata]